jgi:hypothetical protein
MDPSPQQVEHPGAQINGIGLKSGIDSEKPREETPVAITQDQSALRPGICSRYSGKVSEAAALEPRSKGEVLHPAIQASDAAKSRPVGPRRFFGPPPVDRRCIDLR